MRWDATAVSEHDDVAVVLRNVTAGERVVVRLPGGERAIVARGAIPLCHKIALRDLVPGATVLRYGQCIGETTTLVALGEWVHVHNLRSRRAVAHVTGGNDMSPGFDAEAFVDSACAAVSLPIHPEQRAAVADNVRRLHAMADALLAFPLPTRASDDEPRP